MNKQTVQKTTVAKAVDATKGQHPQTGDRGLYDSPAKRLVATRYILAWIVKSCVARASALPLKEIATKCIAPEISISRRPVYREDAEAEDPGRVGMKQTEDSSQADGVVRYDILFTLQLPGVQDPIMVVVNVELQNRVQLGYPLPARGMSYVARLLGEQGPRYNDLHKVYSIWIVSNPDKADENSIVRYAMMKQVDDGEMEVPDEEADLMEVIFLNLGEPEDERDPEHPSLLWLLDVLFSKSIDTDEKKKILETDFDIPMTKEMEDDMAAMRDARFGFEVEAEQRGRIQGRDEGRIQGRDEGRIEGRNEGRNEMLYTLVKDQKLMLPQAAQYAGVSEAEFEEGLREYEAAHAFTAK